VSASDGGSSAGSPSPSRSPSPSPCPDRRGLRGRWRLRDARHGDRRGGARGRSGAHDLRDRRAAGVRGPGQARAVALGERRLDPHRPRLAAVSAVYADWLANIVNLRTPEGTLALVLATVGDEPRSAGGA